MQNARRRVGVRGIIVHEGRLLCACHWRDDGSRADYWAIPGGGLDPGESLEDGVRRELVEETGIEPVVGRLLFVQQFRSSREDADEELEFFYLIENPEAFLNIDLSKTTHGTEEIAEMTFIDPRRTVVLPAFLQEVDLESYVRTPRPVFHYVEL